MQLSKYLVLAASLATATLAYDSNCEGSFLPVSKEECAEAINNIDTTKNYSEDTEFSSGHCYLKYATNGGSDSEVSGQEIRDVAQNIIDNCHDSHGSYGIDNCDECHVTVNYRS
ncbi:hypothetical protein PHISCL_07881 [Aspergillus sclerotialis]|uniref:Uncharacterized protein n=1 Tax=Aspergillus sclerotialis TaxID=2070753 RepID=A0A3A2ZBY1_9EURO|nr:hypothetical protein PHISCL_07881 [Aspergillus sclerotialis]